MPRVKVQLPDPLLQIAADHAHAAGKKIDDVYEAAIIEFVEANQHTRRDALRNKGGMAPSSPKLTIELSEKVFEDAEKLAKRLGKRRDLIYALALHKYVAFEENAPSAFDQGHDLPEGAWRAKKSS
jgi:hypothetical protein